VELHISSIALSFLGALMTPIISAWLIYNTSGLLYHALIAVFTVIVSVYLQVKEVITDLLRILHLDLGVGVISSAINSAIFTDISYSMYFLMPGVLLVLGQRWSLGRRMLLNLTLMIADHPEGALYAIASILMAWVTEITNFFKK
jgi:hypothetical protein